jgi:CPA1 family monovalent cation:H+ antiporter
VTLLGPGSLLPWVVRRLDLARSGRAEAESNRRDERAVRVEGIDAVLRALDERAADVPESVVASLRRHHTERRENAGADPAAQPLHAARLQLALIAVEHSAIARAYAENRLTDEARRRIERELDLEEARIRHALSCSEALDGDPAH